MGEKSEGVAPETPKSEPVPRVIDMPRMGRAFLFAFVVIAAILILAFLWDSGYFPGREAKSESVVAKGLTILSIIIIVWLVYLVPSKSFDAAVKRHADRTADIIMIRGLIRALMLLVATFAILSVIWEMAALLAVIGAFAGMFLGWSLQGPVSGFVAWILITIKRPFRIGDRVLFPSWGLIGDVLDVGVMHTRLNQVGGTVGSEDKSNREILIPNAILWANVIINYTSSLQAAGSNGEAPTSRYVLDEVVTRVTFDSDWEEAERILVGAAKAVTGQIVKESGMQPYVRSDMYDYGVYMRLRFMTVATDRPRVTYEITKRIVKGFQESNKVDFAIPWVYSFRKATGEKGPSV
jgi:small-conductance mechanosensitive channel